jgi:homocysteine S-methyltransferase
VDGSGHPCWLSLTCAEGLTRAKERPETAFAMARDVAEVVAVGVNCTAPGEVAALAGLAGETSGKPVVVYPNSGEGWDPVGHRWVGQRSFAPGLVKSWVAAGACLVGGCCRVGPAEIRHVASALTSP